MSSFQRPGEECGQQQNEREDQENDKDTDHAPSPTSANCGLDTIP